MLIIRQLRQSKGLSIRGLAKLASVPYSQMHDIEIGHKLPRQDELEKIASALGVSVDDLYKK